MKKVLVVGLTCLDILNICDHFPEEDEDMRVISQHWLKGGNAANTACVLAQHQDLEVHLLSCLSGKNEHLFISEEIKKAGVNIDLCPIYERMFPTSTCIINKKTGSRTILHYPAEFPSLKVDDFCKVNSKSYDWIHFEGRDLQEYGAMIDYVTETRGSSAYPVISGEMEKVKKLPHLEKYILPKVDVLFVSKDIALHKSMLTPNITVHRFSLNKSIKAQFIICPWGSVGAAAAERVDTTWKYHSCDAMKLDQVVDTLGAGDTFIAGVIFYLIKQEGVLSAIQYACWIAGKKCGQYGFKGLIT